MTMVEVLQRHPVEILPIGSTVTINLFIDCLSCEQNHIETTMVN